MTNEQRKNPDPFTAGTMIVLYETHNGWRYRVGQRDDGNYRGPKDALDAAQGWLRHHPQDDVIGAR